MPSTVTLAESLLLDGFGSGVELDTLALFDSVVSRAVTVAVIVTVAVLSAVERPQRTRHRQIAAPLRGLRIDDAEARVDRIADRDVLSRRRTGVLNGERERDRVPVEHGRAIDRLREREVGEPVRAPAIAGARRVRPAPRHSRGVDDRRRRRIRDRRIDQDRRIRIVPGQRVAARARQRQPVDRAVPAGTARRWR